MKRCRFWLLYIYTRAGVGSRALGARALLRWSCRALQFQQEQREEKRIIRSLMLTATRHERF